MAENKAQFSSYNLTARTPSLTPFFSAVIRAIFFCAATHFSLLELCVSLSLLSAHSFQISSILTSVTVAIDKFEIPTLRPPRGAWLGF